MNQPTTFTLFAALAVALPSSLCAQAPAGRKPQLPDAPGRDTAQKVCGSTCHGPELLMGRGRSREQWAQVVTSMVSRGAKASDAELVQVVDYLSRALPPNRTPAQPETRTSGSPRPVRLMGAGPDDVQIVDEAASARGKQIYIAECITCHGNKARGANANVAENQKGSDLVRSLVVLHDRYGSTIGPFLKKGHPTQSGASSARFSSEQIADLSHFLHDKVNDTLRSGPYSKVLNVLTGDAKAGAQYFNGAGRCNTCHSPTGDLKGIGKKYDPPTLQTRFLFPRTIGFGRRGSGTPAKPVTVTVTSANGETVSGVLDRLDDFNVSLRDASGEYHSWKRTPGLKVEKHDPYAAHNELLDEYTDKNMHDVVAYLETLQ